VKMRHIRQDPRIAILVDGERKRGVLLQGNAQVIRDAQGKDQALVRLEPVRVRSWRL
jgi:general stress protein 26